MPKRNDIETILVIGSGPIVIGQACEFDYSGTQACKVLKGEGYRVVLVNSNPATIMTDPAMADRTYVEPITADFIERVIARERPDALLPTLGGQTGLNAAVELAESGILENYGVEMIGCDLEASTVARTVSCSTSAWRSLASKQPAAIMRIASRTLWPSWKSSGIRWFCARASPWAAPAAVSRTTRRSCA